MSLHRWDLRAAPGDRLVIRGHHAGEPEQDAEILEVGEGGSPPFLVRWMDDGRMSRFYPGSDAYVDHLERANPEFLQHLRDQWSGSAEAL